MLRSILAAFTVLVSTPAALSNPPEVCPPDIEQQLYTMAQKIEADQQNEIDPVLALARNAINQCADRTHAQALAALLMSSVMTTANDVQTLSDYLTLANLAVAQNDASWSQENGKITLTKLDGTPNDFFGYTFASRVQEDHILPGLARLWQNNVTHPLVSGDGMICPYADNSSSRLETELRFWGKIAGVQDLRDRHTLIRTRLKALHSACPREKLDLSWALANSYGRELIRLTDWSSRNSGTTMFGTTVREYTVPALPLETFSRSEMETKKAELDAEARLLIAPIQQYLADYRAAYKAVDTSNMSTRERGTFTSTLQSRRYFIEDWEDAIKQLELID